MHSEFSMPARGFDGDKIRVGRSSWNPDDRSVKFAHYGVNGQVTRGGEVPIEVVPLMQEAIIRYFKDRSNP